MTKLLKIGEVSHMVGISIRTLRYYDEIHLLKPAQITDKGYRLYNLGNVSRLYQILSLKEMGFKIDDIISIMNDPKMDIHTFIQLHITRTQEEIANRQLLLGKLTLLSDSLQAGDPIQMEEFLATASFLQTAGNLRISSEQFENLKNRGSVLATDRELSDEWVRFIHNLTDCYKRNAPASDTIAQKCLTYWTKWNHDVVGSDLSLGESIYEFHENNTSDALRYGLTNELFRYLQDLRNQNA